MEKQVHDDEAGGARDMSARPDSRGGPDAAEASARPRRRRLASGLRLLFLAVVLVTALVRHFQGAG